MFAVLSSKCSNTLCRNNRHNLFSISTKLLYSSTLKLSQLAPLLFLLRCLEADLRCHLSRCQHFSLQIEIISCAKELNPTAAFTCDILFAENVVWAGSTQPSSIDGLWIRRLVVSCICNSHLGTRKCLMLCSSELCEHTFESFYANVVDGFQD